jgi:uncharacterized protein (DUF433 family)
MRWQLLGAAFLRNWQTCRLVGESLWAGSAAIGHCVQQPNSSRDTPYTEPGRLDWRPDALFAEGPRRALYYYAEGSMAAGYVEQREGGYYIVGSRVSLDSVAYAFLRGESPEGIAESFPALSLEQVFGAVAFYLANRERIDAYLRDGRVEFADMRDEARRKHPALYSKLEAARNGAPSSST